MFSFIAKIIKQIAHYPKIMIGLFTVLALLCIIPIENLRWEIQLQDTLNGIEIQADQQEIENSFGGIGSLTVVMHSSDSLANYNLARDLARELEKDSLVHYVDYETDVEFFKKNRLLYASEDDLSQVIATLDSIKDNEIRKRNPFLVDLQDKAARPPKKSNTDIIQKIEKKYFQNLQQNFSNEDGTIRVVDIYPTHSLSDLQSNRHLYNRVKSFIAKNGNGIDVFYSGKVLNSIKTGKMLLPEAKFAGGIAAIGILFLLIINFYKQPQLIFIVGLPIALPTIMTLALAEVFFGRINLFSLMLGMMLPVHACQITTHVFTRYFQERERKLSPTLCIESALLGVGPVATASSLIVASLFIALLLVPLPGLKEFGILGAAGCMLNLIVCPLLTTSLLVLLQRRKPFKVSFNSPTCKRHLRFFSNRGNWIIIIVLSIVSATGWIYCGTNLSFLYDFKKTEMQLDEKEVQDLIDRTGFSNYDPVIIMLPDSSHNAELFKDFEKEKKNGTIPDLDRLYTQYHFLPKTSPEKKRQIENLKQLLTSEMYTRLGTADSAAISDMLNNYENDIRDFELTEKIRRKFADKAGNEGVFAFIIPSTSPDNGLNCRHIASQLKRLDGIQNRTFKICGTPILRASILDTILGNVDKSIMAGTVLLWFILLLFYNKLSRAFFTMLPSLFAMSWMTILIHLFGIHISAYTSLAFVILTAVSVDGSLHLWSSYYEKQGGNAWTVLQVKQIPVLIAQGATFITAIAMLLSSHPGIYSLGQIMFIGLICISVSQFIIYPLVASTLDAYRILKKAKLRHERLIHKNS